MNEKKSAGHSLKTTASVITAAAIHHKTHAFITAHHHISSAHRLLSCEIPKIVREGEHEILSQVISERIHNLVCTGRTGDGKVLFQYIKTA
jgi:Tfp pilus assembly pilus retraction ATPase PilT